MKQVSQRFKRALEVEIRRLTEIQLGQGGNWGRVQRDLDQRMSGLTDLYESLDRETYQLLKDCQRLKKESVNKGPTYIAVSKGDLMRFDAMIRDLEQATKIIDQLGAIL
jgi:hypothetical protein